MPIFDTTRRVQHTAEQMFELVADVRTYPQFLPFCTGLDLIEERAEGDRQVFVARMEVGFKAIRESFKTRVACDRASRHIDVEYIDGPFRYLKNRWVFRDLPDGQNGTHASQVSFHIEYEFKSRMLALLVGSMFDQAFRAFASSFERRANQVYGRPAGRAGQGGAPARGAVPDAGQAAGQGAAPKHYRPPSSAADEHRPADTSA